MLSRVAENVFWLSRYLERAEGTARLVNTQDKMLMDLSGEERQAGWQSLVSIAGMDTAFSSLAHEADEESVTRFLLADPNNPGSLINAANAIRVNLRSSRDTFPQVLYERINGLCGYIRRHIDSDISTSKRQHFLSEVEHRLLAITGTIEGSLSHDIGYLMVRMGGLLERADMTSRVLDVRASSLPSRPMSDEPIASDEREWMSVLRSLSAYQMFRLHMRRPINGPDVLAFLMLDADLPRAYRFCLDHLGTCIEQLGANNREALDALGRLQRQLTDAELTTLARDAIALHEFIDSLQGGLADVADAIADAYFPPREEVEETEEDTDIETST